MTSPQSSEPASTEERSTSGLLSDTLFVVWGFPEPTQTFIHREMVHMRRLGAQVHVLAGPRRDHPGPEADLQAIVDDALFLGTPAAWIPRGLAWAARHPKKFTETLRWMRALPHRTSMHRRRASGMVLAAAAVADAVQAKGIRYLHAHFAAYQTEWTMALARLLDLPFGVTFHAYGIWQDRNLLERKVRDAEVVLTCTDYNVKHLRELAGDDHSHVHLVYHGLDLTRHQPAEQAPLDGPLRLVAIGRLIEKKGFGYLLDGLGSAVKRGIDARLTLIGDGPLREALTAQTHALDLQGHVTFAGSVPNTEVWRTLASAHALVAPSMRDATGNIDGIPNVILEAMASARPVIGSALSGIPEVVKTGETGVLVPPEDAEAIAEAIAVLSADRTAAAEMGRAARAVIEGHFDVEQNMVRQLELMATAKGR